ncbi:uncharacterized protein LOC130418887 isoform X2 [Triplophysa dalaica]|uniref:uncharacterized protein LOC130418887 isoform X2 n=1 Tax=Triplophysa dalaica TaxID=1582913 RepID=UPI0024DF90DE|nr:uncharacterized protein LOC130418887 isoform X2 [Triplophysa dalaica]
MKHFVLMCLLFFIHTSQSQIHHQSSTEGADVFLICKHEGKVQWSKGRDGNRKEILTAESKEEIKKHSADPHNRYSVLDDLSLHIKNVSLSDSGIYYCNATATVNLTVTASDFSKLTASSNSSTEATTPPPETTSVSETSNTNHTDQPKLTEATPTSDNISVTTSSSQLNTTVSSTTDLSKTSARSSTRTEETNKRKTILSATLTTSRATTSTTDLSPTSKRSSTRNEETKTKTTASATSTNSTANSMPSKESFSVSIKIAMALSGGVVFVVLVLLRWAWIKRKAALSNKKENIYETVEDSDFTAQPVPSQKPNDAIYYLAGDPDIVKLGQIKETDDHTYTLISQSEENITEQEEGVPLYSTIEVDTINQP